MMQSIAKIVIGLPVEGPFDYLVPDEFIGKVSVGHRVRVPFGRRTVTGYITGFSDHSDVKGLKSFYEPMEDKPLLLDRQIELGRWVADYYGCSLGEAIEVMIPFAVRKKKMLAVTADAPRDALPGRSPGVFEGRAAHSLFLSQGESAAWAEAACRIQACLDQGKGVLLLAPDHGVSDRVYRYCEKHFGVPVMCLERGTPKQQTAEWLRVRNGEGVCVLGLRSAVFAPVWNLGLAVMFGEHQYGYQEDQAPFYHARDILLRRAADEGFGVIFSSPAPTVELWSAAQDQGFEVAFFPQEPLAQFQLIDVTNYKPRRESYLSIPLADAVRKALDGGERVLIIYNRRGFNTVTKCGDCGHIIACPRCRVPYVYGQQHKDMWCPSCGSKGVVMDDCPKCRARLLHYGEGIERIKTNLAGIFPQARLAVFDRDTKTVPKRANLIIATQAVLRVLRDLNIQLAGILDIDAALSHFDFRCQQKVFSLLIEVRAAVLGRVCVQTKNISHIVLDCAVKNDLERFYRHERGVRLETGFPPEKHLVAVMFRGEQEEDVSVQADRIYDQCVKGILADLEILPPQPDFQPKQRGKYRFMMMAKCLDVAQTVGYIKGVLRSARKKRGVFMTVHVNP